MHDLSLHLLDVIENSVRAGATNIRILVAVDRATDTLSIAVEDDGPGLQVLPREALDPFYTTKEGQKTGLGLSLFSQAAEAAGGGLCVGRSADLRGTFVRARLGLNHVDRPPLGDVATSIVAMVATNPEVDFTVDLVDGDERLSLRGSELPQKLPAIVAFQKTLP